MKLPPCAAQTLERWLSSADLARANLVCSGLPARLVKRLNRAGITLGKTVLFGEGHYNPFSPEGLALMAHELKHVEQYGKEGTMGFLAKYLWHWVAQGFKYSEEIPFEKEAFELERKVMEHLQREFAVNGHRGPCVRDAQGKAIANANYRELPLAA